MIKKPNILVVGSFVMDQIAITNNFPREGETILGRKFQIAPGGKGANQAVQAAKLGANVTMVGKIGKDENGQKMIDVCRMSGINTNHVLIDDNEKTGCSVIVLEEKPDHTTANRIIVIPGANMTIKVEEVFFLREMIWKFDMVVLQQEIPMEVNEIVCQYAYEAGVPIMLNPAPSAAIPDSILNKVTFLSPNEQEAENLTGFSLSGLSQVDLLDRAGVCASSIVDKGPKNVIITLGVMGAIYKSSTDRFFSPAIDRIQVVDPTAAGDSFVAAFCCAICTGMNVKDALCFANHTAALTVSKLGAMPSLPSLDSVELLLKTGGYSFTGLDVLKQN